MPYVARRRGSKWVVTKPGATKVFGTHESRAKALRQVRALYSSEEGTSMPEKKDNHGAKVSAVARSGAGGKAVSAVARSKSKGKAKSADRGKSKVYVGKGKAKGRAKRGM